MYGTLELSAANQSGVTMKSVNRLVNSVHTLSTHKINSHVERRDDMKKEKIFKSHHSYSDLCVVTRGL